MKTERMGQNSTVRKLWATQGLYLLLSGAAIAQPLLNSDWRRIGNSAIDLSLSGPASGAVDRVWFDAEGVKIFARMPSGAVYVTEDLEGWQLAPKDVAPTTNPNVQTKRVPIGSRMTAAQFTRANKAYAAGLHVWRSENGGEGWQNVTSYKGQSILGGEVFDLAVSPKEDDEIVAGTATGVWRSVDGGKTWLSLNAGLPNLAVRRILATPNGPSGLRLELKVREQGGTFTNLPVEWRPGEKLSWRPAADAPNSQESALVRLAQSKLGGIITTAQTVGDTLYAGSLDGRLFVSLNRGVDWLPAQATGAGRVEAFAIDSRDPRRAVAVISGGVKGAVWRTWTGGSFWEEITGDLNASRIRGVTFDQSTGAVYAASNEGVHFTYLELTGADPAGAAKQWTRIGGNLPEPGASDVKLDPAGNQLYVALDGWGVYATMAPHRLRQLRAVSAADGSLRPAAPGSLISIIGASVDQARAGDQISPVLARSAGESQIQLPFQLTGTTVSLQLETSKGRTEIGMLLEPTSPAVFVDRDGTPMVLNADSGVLLDLMQPARAGTRIQILAAGLGRVTPDWPAGVAAPLNAPPKVMAPVRVFLDRVPLEVTKATLAPGIVGFYLVEVTLPSVVNAGPAELYLETGRAESNRVRIYLEQ